MRMTGLSLQLMRLGDSAPGADGGLWCTLPSTVMRKTVVVSDLMPYLLRFSQQASLEIPLIVS